MRDRGYWSGVCTKLGVALTSFGLGAFLYASGTTKNVALGVMFAGVCLIFAEIWVRPSPYKPHMCHTARAYRQALSAADPHACERIDMFQGVSVPRPIPEDQS